MAKTHRVVTRVFPGRNRLFFHFVPFPSPLPPLTLPLRYRPCRVDVSLDLVSLLAVHYQCCALLTFCSAVQKDFLRKNVMNRGEQDISKAKGIVIRKVACAEKRSYVSKHFFILW